jgi:bacillithiol system protein YtxJ
MSVFNYIFGKSANEEPSNSKINWIQLGHLDQLDKIVAFSSQKPIVIFKHSTRCSISRMVLKRFESEYDLDESIDTYFLDLLEHRDISNEIASRFGVYHQSPQLILIKDGKAIYDVSHESIDAGELKAKL